jgi:hypothetical protein
MCVRIRESMRDTSGSKLGGPGTIVEADELYVGCKPRKGQKGRTRADDHKVPVAVLVERRPGFRSIVGAFHHVSPEHLSRHCDEVAFPPT